ncbi:DUF2079 domain-containing protein, partial [Candidatus Margulisiibacteriota bacterium]
FSLNKLRHWFDQRGVGRIFGFAAVVWLLYSALWGPGFSQLIGGYTFMPPSKLSQVEALMKNVPAAASIMTQTPFSPYFSSRREIFLVNQKWQAEYILLDYQGDCWPLSREDYNQAVKNLQHSGQYDLIGEIDSLKLFKRRELIIR